MGVGSETEPRSSSQQTYMPFHYISELGEKDVKLYSSHPHSRGIHCQIPQWVPETMGSTKHYTYYVFAYSYIPVINFKL